MFTNVHITGGAPPCGSFPTAVRRFNLWLAAPRGGTILDHLGPAFTAFRAAIAHVIGMWGFPYSHGGYPNSWMVYFREHPFEHPSDWVPPKYKIFGNQTQRPGQS